MDGILDRDFLRKSIGCDSCKLLTILSSCSGGYFSCHTLFFYKVNVFANSMLD